MQNLSGYRPEKPKDGSSFEAFRYNGVVSIEKAIVSENTRINSEFYPMGCKQLDIEAIVMDPKSPFIGRKLWKRFNLDSEKEDKNGKTPAQKLADQLFAVGLTFIDEESLDKALAELVTLDVVIKAYPADFKDGRDKFQMWNMKGRASDVVTKPNQSTIAF